MGEPGHGSIWEIFLIQEKVFYNSRINSYLTYYNEYGTFLWVLQILIFKYWAETPISKASWIIHWHKFTLWQPFLKVHFMRTSEKRRIALKREVGMHPTAGMRWKGRLKCYLPYSFKEAQTRNTNVLYYLYTYLFYW